MANSTKTIASMVSFVKTFPDLSSVVQLPAGGASLQPALTIAEDVMIAMIAEDFNWKWNRFLLPQFYTNSYQQDYALNVVNLGWLENAYIVDYNSTTRPKPQLDIEVVKDLPSTAYQYGYPGQACWVPNNLMTYGTWAALTTFVTPIGATQMPANPLTQIKDPNGNFWYVSTYGTTGASQPSWPTTLVYPTQAAPNAAATTQADGSVVWTVLNPVGQGIRLNPISPQTGVVWQVNVVAQYRAFAFSNGPYTLFNQTIEPIPDDFAKYFRDGFVAMAYEHSADTKVRGMATDKFDKWMKSLRGACAQGDRERENNGFYPSSSIMGGPYSINPGPAYPFPLY